MKRKDEQNRVTIFSKNINVSMWHYWNCSVYVIVFHKSTFNTESSHYIEEETCVICSGVPENIELKLGVGMLFLFFLFFDQKIICCGYSLELPRNGLFWIIPTSSSFFGELRKKSYQLGHLSETLIIIILFSDIYLWNNKGSFGLQICLLCKMMY